MWTREEVKTRAKDVLRVHYWKAFVASLVIMVASASGGGGGRGGSSERHQAIGSGFDLGYWFILLILIIAVMTVAFRIFLGFALEVGGRKFFIETAQNRCDLGRLGYAFGSGNYFAVVGAMLLQSVYIILWSLLLIIPGIIKSYSYKMVPYILADNPQIGAARAIELSKEMTNGEKWNMFVLDLSFIGWYLLGLLALVVGTLFVRPYDDATHAELYLLFRNDALDRGLTTREELRLEAENAVF